MTAVELFEVRACRECGCTDDQACVVNEVGACRWVDLDLCSACQPSQTPVRDLDPTRRSWGASGLGRAGSSRLQVVRTLPTLARGLASVIGELPRFTVQVLIVARSVRAASSPSRNAPQNAAGRATTSCTHRDQSPTGQQRGQAPRTRLWGAPGRRLGGRRPTFSP